MRPYNCEVSFRCEHCKEIHTSSDTVNAETESDAARNMHQRYYHCAKNQDLLCEHATEFEIRCKPA